MEQEEKEIKKLLLASPDGLISLNANVKYVAKIGKFSEEKRKEGNNIFQKSFHSSKEHQSILKLYNMSITWAPGESEELALGYGNRSAFLFHVKQYEGSIVDIERAMGITKSNVLKIKLLCRKVKCLSVLNHSKVEDALNEINLLLDDIPENNSNKEKLLELFKDTKNSLKTIEQLNQNVEKIEKEDELNEKEDVFKSVAIKYDEKFGRHLVATRDFKPGEIIFVEKLLINSLDPKKMFTNCYHCFKKCWTGIPCNNCNWAIFCNEECKNQAMHEYHDIECSFITILSHHLDTIFGSDCIAGVHIPIRLLIIGLKEAGSIAKLRNNVESESEDLEDFLKSKRVENKFIPVLKLDSEVAKEHSQLSLYLTLIIMMTLAKNTSLFGKKLKFKKPADLIENGDFIFISTLFLKLMRVKQINSFNHSNLDMCYDDLQSDDSGVDVGSCIGLVASLINHSCVPNAGKCFTKDKRIIILATLPIRKNSQIFISYKVGSFNNPSKDERLTSLAYHKFTCECQACKYQLLDDLILNEQSKNIVGIQLNKTFWLDYQDHLLPCNWKVVEGLSKAVIKATQCLPESSLTIHTLSSRLEEAFCRIYDFERNIHDYCTEK